MPTMQIQDSEKLAVEQLLLGDKTVQLYDCNGNLVEGHGLMANDLLVRSLQGDLISLPQYVRQYAGDTPNIANAVVVLDDGSTVTVKEMAESLGEVEFRLSDLEDKYNNN
jgi:hypothetical protein